MNEDILKKLSEPLSKEAIQRTKGTETKKGYDTTGLAYQYVVDRFNDILGSDWGFTWEIIHEVSGTYKSGTPFTDITVKINIWVKDQAPRSCIGGHTAINYADAVKGAITNGFKKTAAFWGVGREAFAGTIDDDNQPLPDSADNKTESIVKEMFHGEEVKDTPQLILGQEIPKAYWNYNVNQRKLVMPKGLMAEKNPKDNKWYVVKWHKREDEPESNFYDTQKDL